MSTTQDTDGTDPLVEALRRKVSTLADRVETLEHENRELRDTVDDLKTRVPDSGRIDYKSMDKTDRVAVIRSKLRDVAASTNGKSAMGYKDVIAVFDGEPSPGYAYDLMRATADGDAFRYDPSPDGVKRVTYTADRDV